MQRAVIISNLPCGKLERARPQGGRPTALEVIYLSVGPDHRAQVRARQEQTLERAGVLRF